MSVLIGTKIVKIKPTKNFFNEHIQWDLFHFELMA